MNAAHAFGMCFPEWGTCTSTDMDPAYAGFAPAKLQTVIESKGRSPEEMQRFILAYLLLHFVITSARAHAHS